MQTLIEAGFTPEEAKTATYGNVISRAVGIHPTVKPDTLYVELMPGDEYIICSDGLHGYLEGGELQGGEVVVAVGRDDLPVLPDGRQ